MKNTKKYPPEALLDAAAVAALLGTTKAAVMDAWRSGEVSCDLQLKGRPLWLASSWHSQLQELAAC